MKRLNFKTIMYLLCVFIAAFGVLYLMWTGANYLFIDGNSTKANTLDIVMIAIIAWFATKDTFLCFYGTRRNKHEDMSASNHQHRSR